MRAVMRPAPRLRLLLLVLGLESAVALTLFSAGVREWAGVMRSGMPRAARVPLPAVPVEPAPDPYTVLVKYPFEDQASLVPWEEKVFRKKSLYRVTGQPGKTHLESSSQASSSGLFRKVDVKAAPGLFLDWRWRAKKFPVKRREKLSDRSQDDFAARIYVVFAGTNFFNTRVIEYIWDEKLAPDTASSSPFSSNVKLFVVASGLAAGDGWRHEERNVRGDYKKLFGSEPDRPIAAIALMTDSDNTGTESAADFGDFTLKMKKTAEETP
jgi:hypothetical protein